ncbi:hypothetical protein [Streptomyces mexicanus]|nr:hypothetical protein [Streptomyces mexicanus]
MGNGTMREDASGSVKSPRLLPWTHEGEPCWLSAGSEGGVLSGLADAIEAEQMRDGHEVLFQSRGLLEQSERLGVHEWKLIALRLTESLADVLRVSESRGIRLGVTDPTLGDDAEEIDEVPTADE